MADDEDSAIGREGQARSAVLSALGARLVLLDAAFVDKSLNLGRRSDPTRRDRTRMTTSGMTDHRAKEKHVPVQPFHLL